MREERISDLIDHLLKQPGKNFPDAETFWDGRAETFYSNQENDRSYYPEEIVKILKQEGILTKDKTVLEIGAGSGRFTRSIGENSKKITATDVSSKMLSYITEKSHDDALVNVECQQLDWSKVSLEEKNWEKQFDLVFAVMCPAVKSEDALKKMTQASRDYCFIAQYIQWDDKQPKKPSKGFNPHNDRDAFLAYFIILWTMGLNPETVYLQDDQNPDRSSTLALIIWKVQ